MAISIYVASKTIHADKWRKLRKEGHNIVSTWIDEAGEGESADYEDLAARCISEAAAADITLLYAEPEEILKGALFEAGAALAVGRPVYFVGECSPSRVLCKHPLWLEFDTVEAALEYAVETPHRLSLAQVVIAFGKYINGYRPGDDIWSDLDTQAYREACLEEFARD